MFLHKIYREKTKQKTKKNCKVKRNFQVSVWSMSNTSTLLCIHWDVCENGTNTFSHLKQSECPRLVKVRGNGWLVWAHTVQTKPHHWCIDAHTHIFSFNCILTWYINNGDICWTSTQSDGAVTGFQLCNELFCILCYIVTRNEDLNFNFWRWHWAKL